jgi:hypothetical protein
VEPGQKLVLCAANVGTGAVDVTLEFINLAGGGVAAEKTVTLQPLGDSAAGATCVTMAAGPATGASATPPIASTFTSTAAGAGPADTPPMVVGVAMVRKSLLSFREAQVTASIQVLAPGANGTARLVATIPLSRTTHPADGAPVYAPPAAESGHRK